MVSDITNQHTAADNKEAQKQYKGNGNHRSFTGNILVGLHFGNEVLLCHSGALMPNDPT
jgi:hypothetical protein